MTKQQKNVFSSLSAHISSSGSPVLLRMCVSVWVWVWTLDEGEHVFVCGYH